MNPRENFIAGIRRIKEEMIKRDRLRRIKEDAPVSFLLEDGDHYVEMQGIAIDVSLRRGKVKIKVPSDETGRSKTYFVSAGLVFQDRSSCVYVEKKDDPFRW